MADNFQNTLTARQQEAVTFSGGPLLVLAGAGSGKTRVLTYRVAWFIDQGRVRSENVLLLTFTNKAATEMKERVLNLIHEVPAFAGTFHSFCVRVLRKDGLAIDIPANFLIYDEDDSKEIIKEILTELNLSTDKYNPNAISSQISEAKNQMLTPSLYAELVRGEWQGKGFKIWTEYEKLLKKVGALDFDDLLLKAVKLFDESPETLTRWQDVLTHIFVDEWQDTNKVQYKLTKQLVEQNENLTAVGDAAQSIYSWRGADFRNINNLIRDYPKLKVYRARSELDEAQFVLGEVDKLITQGLEFHDFAILYRTNAQSRVLEEAFLHAGIPYTLVGGVRFCSRKEVKDVISFLRLLVNPKDRVSKKRIEKLGIRQGER